MSEDEGKAFENALVDKLGKNDIKWEKDGFIDSSKLWLTYEETIDANTSQRPLQTEEKSRDRVGGASDDNQRYTLDMVRIDNKIREVVMPLSKKKLKYLS